MFSTKTFCVVVTPILLLIITGCAKLAKSTPTSIPSPETPLSTILVSLTPTQTPTSVSLTPTPLPTIIEPTLGPTLPPTERATVLLDLMQTNGDCELPCVLGIAPGLTSFEEGKRIFEQMGWSIWEQTSQSGKSLEAKAHYSDSALRVDVMFNEKDGKIPNLSFSIAGYDFLQLVKYYSFVDILTREGKPTKIWVLLPPDLGELKSAVTSFDLYLYYKDQNMLIQYSGIAKLQGDFYHICPPQPWVGSPEVGPYTGNVNLYIGPNAKVLTPEELVRPFSSQISTFTAEQYQVETMLGMDMDAFYQNVLKSKEATCYDIPKSAWP